MASIKSILQFWFHSLTDATPIDKKAPPAKLWFNGGRAFDEEIRTKFLADYEKAKAGGYKDWEETAQGRLALILIFDQFSRSMFRNTPQAFTTDQLALELTQASITDGKDKDLQFIERVFLYMPFMHSEVLSVQEEGVRSFENLVKESKEKGSPNTSYFEYNLNYMRQHRDIIARFGRFPHRNKILGRTSTREETEFLTKPGSSF
ncbi:MAG: DUF924 domain-containing protein [Candidatus Omnitrophica bacterium]|nr:DUF924 domain-containing protein [Candidatus Omnitrophota bacterium]